MRLLDQVIDQGRVQVALGEEPGWHDLALVAAPYRIGGLGGGRAAATDDRAGGVLALSGEDGAAGVIGVIGPQRMDYPKVMAVVDYLSGVVTEKLSA